MIILSQLTCWLLLCCCTCIGSSSAAFARPYHHRYGGAGTSLHVLAEPLVSSHYTTAQKTASHHLAEDYDELPLDFPRQDDVLVALSAVRKACDVTQQLQPCSATTTTTVTKNDMSPVTVGDFAAQAIVLQHLNEAFETDSFIAEESSTALKEDPAVAQEILDITALDNMDQLIDSIDLGKSYLSWEEQGGRPGRVWCLDPIDGTKGFLRGKRAGGQYCVALALLEDGEPTVGILGCPNLPTSATDDNYAWTDSETPENNKDSRGCIFVASKGGGCWQLPLVPGSPGQRLYATSNDGSTRPTSEARFCIGAERAFGDPLGRCSDIARILHGDSAFHEDGSIIKARRMDSQAKYGVLARGGGELYARMPKSGYAEWIWDHAAGSVVIQEAGGCMTDVDGHPIDFSLGPKLSDKVKGILGSNGGTFHEALIGAYQQQEQMRLLQQSIGP